MFTPAPGFSGSLTFQYVASDGITVSGIGVASISVGAAAPVVVTPSTAIDDEDVTEIDPDLIPSHVNAPNTAYAIKPKSADDFESNIETPAITLVEVMEQTRLASVIVVPTTADSGNLMVAQAGVIESISQFTSVVDGSSPLMFASLDHLESQLDEVHKNIGLAFVASIVSLSGVSIGVVSWILRSGALVTSLMAQMPAWRIIDPLVVLGYLKDDDETDESIEDIIDAGESRNRITKIPQEIEPASRVAAGAGTEELN